MDLKHFDSTLKSALEQIEVPYDPSTWSALESRLEQLPEPDAVDKALRPSLERIELPFEAASWSMLAGRMDGLARVRRLRMTKLAEAAIFLLLLLNLNGFFSVVQSVTHPAPIKNTIKIPIADAHKLKNKKQPASGILPSSTEDGLSNLNLVSQIADIVNNIASTLTNGSEENAAPAATANTPNALSSNGSLLDPVHFYAQSGIIKFPVGATLPIHPVEPLLYAALEFSIPGIPITKSAKPSPFYGSTFASFDQNKMRQNGYSDKTNGYGGGFAIGYRKGKWGVEAGIQYAQKSYQPKRENVEYQNDPFNGISFYHVDNVDAEVFAVPVKVTRRIAKSGKTTAHAVAGLSASFATSKTYGYKTVHYPPPVPVGNPDPNASNIVGLPNGKGVLENGGLSNNAYITADIGLRVEQSLGKRYVAFIEPMYRQSLGSGFGPNTTRINTFSFQAGVMASL